MEDLEYQGHVEAVSHLKEAEKALALSDIGAMDEQIDQVLNVDPSLGRAWELKGLAHLSRYEFDDARAVFEMAEGCKGYFDGASASIEVMSSESWTGGDGDGSDVIRMISLGEAFLQGRMWEWANVCYRALEGNARPKWQVLSTLGLIHRELGYLLPALDYYDRALKDPEVPLEVAYDRTIVLIKVGRMEDAQEGLREILESGWSDPRILNNLGLIREALGDLEGARKRYREALEMDDRYYPAIYSLGRCLQQLGRMEEAKKYMNRALDVEDRVFDMDDMARAGTPPPDGTRRAKELMFSRDESS
ncbi:MAG: tetratricopeptide repeat protein [Thermoplasmata archaeon]|nr:tetratricopeptide repeat protein [Thermoplasmata archaeon]